MAGSGGRKPAAGSRGLRLTRSRRFGLPSLSGSSRRGIRAGVAGVPKSAGRAINRDESSSGIGTGPSGWAWERVDGSGKEVAQGEIVEAEVELALDGAARLRHKGGASRGGS